MSDDFEIACRMVLASVVRKTDALTAIWDTGHWEVSCIKDLAQLLVRNGRQLIGSDQEILLDSMAVIFARVRREAAAEAKRFELMANPRGSA